MKTYRLSFFLFLVSAPLIRVAVAQGLDSCKGSVTYDTTFVTIIHGSLPTFKVHLIEKEDKSHKFATWCYEISLQRGTNTSPQIILGKSSSSFPQMSDEECPDIEFIDLNFDAYLDIKIFNGRAVNGINAGYDAYLFSPGDKAFHHSARFSEILGGFNLELDSSKKLIYSAGELGCMGRCWSKEIYKVVGDSLTLINRTSQHQDYEHPGDFVLTEEELVDGKLTVVSKKIVKY